MGTSSPEALQIADLYRQTFAPRLDAYADWTPTPTPEDAHAGHWTAVRAELTAERVLAGLTGRQPVSTYMEDRAGFTHVGAIDFDSDDGWERGRAVAEVMAAAGAHPYLERSRRGCHLWLVLDDVVGGQAVRLALRWFVRQAREHWPHDPKVEILPKRLEQRGPDTLGNPLRMPMMSHPRTGARYVLAGPDGEPIGPTISAAVVAVEMTSAELIRTVAAAAPVPIAEAGIPSWARAAPREAGDVVPILADAGVQYPLPGRSVRCPIHDDRQASLVISRDGERVWCKSPSCPAFNNGRGLGADQLRKELAMIHA